MVACISPLARWATQSVSFSFAGKPAAADYRASAKLANLDTITARYYYNRIPVRSFLSLYLSLGKYSQHILSGLRNASFAGSFRSAFV